MCDFSVLKKTASEPPAFPIIELSFYIEHKSKTYDVKRPTETKIEQMRMEYA